MEKSSEIRGKTRRRPSAAEVHADRVTVSTTTKPDLKGDRLNFFLLLLLYTMQGLPTGVSTALPIILQSKRVVSYQDQALFSFVLWPYSMKLFWAPIVDALYIQSIGRRKSWLVPVQYIMGICLIFMAYNADVWLPESGTPNLSMIVCVFFATNFLSATQDIIVDGWALTMLKKNNVNYSSTCNGTGLALGMFIGSVSPILLASEEFCNKYLRTTPGTGGLVNFESFLYFWGTLYVIITTLVAVFKKETHDQSNGNNVKISVFQNYKLLWNILKLPSMQTLIIAFLTGRIGFSTMDTVSHLKLIDAGVSKDDIALIIMLINLIKIFLPLIVIKFTSSSKPMNLYMLLMPIRLFWGLVIAALIYYTPILLNYNGLVDYIYLLGIVFIINESLYYVMLVSVYAFFSQISDSRFGCTYMTLLNTVNTLGWVGPNTVALQLVDVLTFHKCSNDSLNNCFTPDLKRTCESNGGDCLTSVDGYYVEVIVCTVAGFVWFGIYKTVMKNLQSHNPSRWLVNVKQTSADADKANCNSIVAVTSM